MKKLFPTLTGFILLLFITPGFSQTTISQNITTQTTWTQANSPYVISETVTVENGSTLTIEEGVEVRFDSGTSLIVSGGLVANGSELSKITFTSNSLSPQSGDWGSVRFNNNANVGSVINHAIFEYGGGNSTGALITYQTGAFGFAITNSEFRFSSVHGIDLRASSPQIFKSTFRDNGGYGIFSDLALSFEVDSSVVSNNTTGGIRVPINSSPSITASTIEGNGTGIFIDNGATPNIAFNDILNNSIGIRVIEASSVSPTITDNTISGNTTIGLRNDGGGEVTADYNFWGDKSGPQNFANPSGTGDIVSNNVDFTPWLFGSTLPVREITLNPLNGDIWYADSVYYVQNNLTLPLSATLTIQPGAVVKFANNVTFNVIGTLIADGTTENKIYFTSQFDDAIGGDSNGDARATQPNRGDWNQIDIDFQSPNSVLNNVDIRFGGSNTHMLYLNNTSVQVTNIQATGSLNNGIYIDQTPASFNNVTSNNNTGEGIYLYQSNSEMNKLTASFNGRNGIYVRMQGLNADISIDSSSAVGNTQNGVHFFNSGSSRQYGLVSLTNSNLSGNMQNGLNVEENGVNSFTLNNNIFSDNENYGATIFLNTAFENNSSIFGNSFENNGTAGLRTTAAQIYSNSFSGNEFGVTAWGRLGNVYNNGSGLDGNTFVGNKFNNVLGLEGYLLKGALSACFPESITSGTYMFQQFFSGGNSPAVAADDTLTIEPGVILKSGYKGYFQNIFVVSDGMLIAEGTEANPIVFTSWRDDNFGGETNIVEDTVSAKPGDWGGLQIFDRSNDNVGLAKFSRLSNIVIRYGIDGLEMQMGNQLFADEIDNLNISFSSNHGMEFLLGRYVVNNSVIENNQVHGVYALRSADVTLRNSQVRNNAQNGLHGLRSNSGQAFGFFREVSNSTIENNGRDGVNLQNVSSPMTFQQNVIRSNTSNGINITITEATTDTVLTISGNRLENNGLAGILSSRAIIVDDTLVGNKYPIGVVGELSKSGTINEMGNFYEGNVIENNEFNDVITVSGGIKGVLGGTKPASFVENIIYGIANVDVASTDTLIVNKGTIIKNNSSVNYSINGHFEAIDTATEKIVFTSILDDTYGGNTNGDSTNVQPAANNWAQIQLNGEATDNSILRNVISRYANYALQLNNSDALVDSSFFSNSNYGVYLQNNSMPTLRSSDFHSNSLYGIFTTSGSNPQIQLSNIYNNEQAGLYQSAGTNIIAQNNYWGDATGPFVDQGADQNLQGTGDRIFLQSGTVNYRPFLTGRNGILLGDVTENGAISSFDASKVLLHVVGTELLTGNALAAADVSGNGAVSAMDASFILQFVVGNISGFPGQGKRQAIDYTEMLALNYYDENGFTDINLEKAGEASLYSAQIELVIPGNHIEEVEFLDSPISEGLSFVQNIEGDTLRIAFASSSPINEIGDFGTLRLIHKTDIEVSNTKDLISFKSFSLDENDITEHMNSEYTSTEDIVDNSPTEFKLNQNFPNPFNPTTNISFSLPQSGEVEIQVYNMLGQMVQTLMSERQKTGNYTVSWDASLFSRGTYLLRINFKGDDNQSYTQVRKMMLIK